MSQPNLPDNPSKMVSGRKEERKMEEHAKTIKMEKNLNKKEIVDMDKVKKIMANETRLGENMVNLKKKNLQNTLLKGNLTSY